MTEQHWRVPVRGPLPDDALARLSAAGIDRHGGSAVISGGVAQETHGLYVRAASGEAAAEKVRAALEGVPVYVAADEAKPVGDL
jgi:hypothetical protein